jgi:hypothetical protein
MTMTVPAGFPAARDTSAPALFGYQSRYVPSGGGFPRISLAGRPISVAAWPISVAGRPISVAARPIRELARWWSRPVVLGTC